MPTDASVEEPAAEAKQGPGEGEQGEFGQATDGDSPPTPPRHSSSSGREDGCDVGRGVGRGVVARRSVGRTRRTSSQSAVALPRPAARVDTDDSSGRSSAEEDALTPLMHGPELVAAAEERRQQRRRSLDSVGGMSAPYAPSAADHPNGADGESDSIYSHRVSAAGDGMEGGEGAEFGTSPLQRPALPPPAAPVEPGVAAEDCHLIADAGSAASASARPALAPTAGSRHSTEGKQRDANAGADAAARRGEGSTAHRHRNRHRRPRAQGSPTSDTRSSSQGSSAKAAHAGLPAQAELPGPQAGTVASAAAAAAAYAQIALSAQAGAPCPLYVRDASGRFVPVSSLHGQAFAAGQRDLPPASMAAGRRRRRDGKLRSSEQASLGGGGASTGGMSTHGSEEAETMSQGRWDTGSGVGRSRAMEHARPATELSPAGPDHSADRGSGSESGSMHPRGSRLASFASWLSAKPAPARPRPRPQIRTATQLMDAKRAQLRAGHAQAVVGSVGGSPPRPMHQDSLSSNEQAPESVGGGRSGGGSAVEAGRRWRTRLHSTHSHATLVTRRTESDLDARQPEWSSQKQGGSFFALAPPVVHGPTPAPSDARTASREERLAAAVRHGVKRTLSSRSSVPLAGLAAAEGAAAGAGAGGEGSPPFAPEASTPVDEAGPLATAQLPPASSSTAVAATAIDTTAAPVAVAAAHAGSATSSNAATDAAVVASTPTSAAAAAAAGGDRASDRWRNASGSVRGTYAEEEKGSAVEGGGEVGGRPGQGSRPAPIRRASSTTALPTGSRIQGVGSARARAAPGQSPDMGVSPGREEGVRRTASGEDEGCRGSESSATAQATASLASRAGDSGPIRKVTTDALQRAAASERRLSAGGADSPARARRRASRNLTAQELAEVMAEAVAPGSPMLRGQNGEQRGSPARERRGSSSVQSPPLKEEEEEEEGGSDGSVDRERGSIGTCVRRSSVSPGLVDEAHVLRIAPRRQSLARHSVMRRASRRVGELFGRFGTLRGGSGDQIGPFRMRRRSSVGKANNEGEDDAEGKGDNGTGAPPVRQLPCLMIHPHSSKRIAWDMLLLTLLVYVSLTIPFRLGFDSPATGGWRLLETMTDFTFLTDVMMNFRTAYVDPDGKLHTRQRTIATHYLRGWFAIDIVSSIPFDLVMDASAGEDDLSSIKVLKVGRVLRTLRAAKLLKLTRFLKVGHLMERLEDEFAVNRNMLGIVKLLLFTAMLCHVNACLYHFIAVLQESAESWTMQGDDPLPQTKVESYVLAFYWSVATLSTVGYGDVRAHTTAERVYATTAMLMGGGYFGYVIAKFSLLVTNLNAHNKIYREKMEAISAYMKNRKLPRELQGRIRRYYRHYLEQRTAFDEAEILNELNTFLRQEVAMHLTHETIYNIPLFEGRDPHFLAQLLTILKPLTASADDLLVQHGERGREMFILIRGTLAVEDRVGDVTRTLRKVRGTPTSLLLPLFAPSL